VWFVVGVFSALSFTAAFLYENNRGARQSIERLEREKRDVGLAGVAQDKTAPLADQDRQKIEQSVREEYESRIATITGELGELYDLETRFRQINGLPPKSKMPAGYVGGTGTEEGGRGGPPTSGDLSDEVDYGGDVLMRPPSVINGVYRPSADLIVQEINLRRDSLREYEIAANERHEQFDRRPAIWPVRNGEGRITSRFGYRKDPFTRDLRLHEGTDVAAPLNSSVVATGAGVVVFAGYDQWLGYCVRIDHGGGIETVYGHLNKTMVSIGDHVRRTQEIGKLGSTGRSTGPHVHYEVRINGRSTDAEKYLGF
jgi:murein DD-endopeptidase MepM/ murein hydrolase activator NlpD